MALCFLLLLALIAAGASSTSTLEHRLSGNNQRQESLRQMTVGAARALAAQRDGFTGGLAFGERRCDKRSQCANAVLQLPSSVAVPTDPNRIHYHIERIGPVSAELAIRMTEREAFSAGRFGFERFEARVEFDERDKRGGAAVVAVGVARRHGLAN